MSSYTQEGGDGPALDATGHPLDRIRLTGISATGYHGVFDHERRDGQTFVADVVVHLDTRRAAASDDLTRTLDYGTLAEHVAAVLAGEPVDLIETVAERVAATVLVSPLVQAVDVTVHKPQAPISVPFADVSVTVRRDRGKLPAAEPWRPTPAEVPVEAAAEPAPAPVATPTGGQHTAVLPVVGAVPLVPPVPAVPLPALTPAPGGAGPTDTLGAAGTSGTAGTTSADEVVEAELVWDALDQAPTEPVEVVLALGSNLGLAQETLRDAVTELASAAGVEVTDVSPLARTAPVGGPEQPDFLNAVVIARTTLSARDLLRTTQRIEADHGRERLERWGPRTLDIDIVLYGSTLAVTDDLELPHPRAHQRAFVLQPWAQLRPDAQLPGLGGGPVAVLAATAPDREGIRWMALDWLTAPVSSAHPEQPGQAEPFAADESIDPAPQAGPGPYGDPAPYPDPAPHVDPAPR
ncbi:2-amino-4-hydroxy-6-hydroxymethyldihydropteridine diphosphokinase [Cellulomonas hominis]